MWSGVTAVTLCCVDHTSAVFMTEVEVTAAQIVSPCSYMFESGVKKGEAVSGSVYNHVGRERGMWPEPFMSVCVFIGNCREGEEDVT